MLSRLNIYLFFTMFAWSFLAAAMPWNEPTTTATPTVTTTLTVTAPGPTTTAEPASSCDTGSVQCCNSVQSATSPSVTTLLGLLGIVLSDTDILVGLTCTPISVIGAGSSSCSANAVCCEDNNFNGLISIGCVPVIL